ncbi:MAG: hypothetical protein NXI04_25545 [Planctomycetaceae bacterium]|nr:hypothetical protein [Planctomycetaceae bacterium]
MNFPSGNVPPVASTAVSPLIVRSGAQSVNLVFRGTSGNLTISAGRMFSSPPGTPIDWGKGYEAFVFAVPAT